MAKDWVGGSAAVFKTLGASNHTDADRQREDYYATEPEATDGDMPTNKRKLKAI